MDTKEVRLEVKPRNNLILTRMEELGIKNAAELSRRIGYTTQGTVGEIINMKVSPFKKVRSGPRQWKKIVRDIANVLFADPEDLFPDSLSEALVPKGAQLFVELAPQELRQLTGGSGSTPLLLGQGSNPEVRFQAKEVMDALLASLQTLSPNQKKVLTFRYGLQGEGEHTLEEVAEKMSVSKSRIRQIEAAALRKMRHPRRAKPVLRAGAYELLSERE